MKPKSVDEYIASLPDWQAETVAELRRIVTETAPEAKEAFKWAQPVYESNGPFCYMKAFKNSVNFGFWRGVDLEDPNSLLQGSGAKMRNVKLTGVADIQEAAFKDFILAAMELNLVKGDPTKNK